MGRFTPRTRDTCSFLEKAERPPNFKRQRGSTKATLHLKTTTATNKRGTRRGRYTRIGQRAESLSVPGPASQRERDSRVLPFRHTIGPAQVARTGVAVRT